MLGSLSDLGVLQLVSGGLQVWELPIAQPQHLPEERAPEATHALKPMATLSCSPTSK